MNPPTFGDLLRQHRVAAGLSQEALAERTGLSVDAVGLLERGARRRPQRHTLNVLADTLALQADERERFLAAARPLPSTIAPSAPSENPTVDWLRLQRPPTPILGRTREVEDIARLLHGEVRLLTLTGPGGVGKTRLAVEAAERLRAAFSGGAVFVPLAPIADPSVVSSTIAGALGVAEDSGRPLHESLEAALGGRELLLVLDNFEHVLPAAPLVADLVAAAPGLRVLVTSRASLHLRAERELPVAPLPIPGAGGTRDFADNPAVALFAMRAHAVQPGFSLTPAVAGVVAAICRRLDGLPLAIELAAARAKVLSPEALLARLDRGTAVLGTGPRDAPARHKFLAATLAWSHGLLGPRERVLFRRLAVFRGGWTLEAAEDVCASDGLPMEAVLDGLASLADQSLVVPPPQGQGAHPRFEMLETIREYAAEQLTAAGEDPLVRARHADYFVALAEVASNAQGELERLHPEHDNCRAALRWAEERNDARRGLRLAAAMARFWFLRGHYAEGRGWLERFLRLDDSVAPQEHEHLSAELARARALEGLAALVYNQGNYPYAATLYEQSIASYRNGSDLASLARALTGLGGVVRDGGDRTRAVALLEEALAHYRGLANQHGIAHTLANLGSVMYFEGEFERAETLLTESVTRYRDLGDDIGLVFPLRFLGLVQAEWGRSKLAAQAVEESLALSRAFGDRGGEGAALNVLGHLARDGGDLHRARALLRMSLSKGLPVVPIGIAHSLESLAGVEAEQGRAPKAARLLGAASKLRDATGDPPLSYVSRRVPADRAAVRATLGAEAFVAEWDAGRRLNLEEALEEALSDE